MKYYIDCDDFCQTNSDWGLLFSLKRVVPNIKLNLFTIPGECTKAFVTEMRETYDWMRLYPHGYMHRTSRECENWSYDVANNYLAQLERENWPRVWKSPGWRTSDDLYRCLADREWIVAAQEYDRDRIPDSLKVYYLDNPWKIHGHIGHWGKGTHNTNSLQYICDSISALKGEFGFIDELWDGRGYEIQE